MSGNKILDEMAREYESGAHKSNAEAMRAALLWLADNVSDEMGAAVLVHMPDTAFRADIKKAIAAALRQAVGEDKK